MIKKFKNLKKYHEIYKRERYLENTESVMNLKTGISRAEIKRIMEQARSSGGVTKLFGRNFFFSHGEAFIHLLDEIFLDEVYKFESETDDPYIIDCGANVGVSILYFIRRFPKAKIVGFEPDDNVFNLLQKNVDIFDDNKGIEVRKEAVWIEDTQLSFYSEGGVAGSSIVDYSRENNILKVKAIDLKKYLDRPIDFLKIDIEGAENELIFNIAPLLGNVKNLFLEYHGLTDQPQNLGDVLNILKIAGFEYYIKMAADPIQFPYCEESKISFNQQLNIFCFRKKNKT